MEKVYELRELEESLMRPSTRRTPAMLTDLLADGFREFGSSGRIYTKEEVIAALQSEARGQITIADFNAVNLSSDCVLVTYQAVMSTESGAPVTTLRSSIWVRRDGRWQMLFHQGTKLGG